ncbi:hypothetical protein [Rurimicrobium arvi]|uniref:hypothetical protein n=1 Tax=Rurimicrobium arvi TaxID=2049916 RepID=UPI0031E09CE7
MRRFFTIFLLVLSAFAMSATFSSCFLFRHRGRPQYRQAPPPRTTTINYNRKAIRTSSRGKNYKNQYRSDWRGHRGGRDPYHYRGSRYRY